jgi:ribosome modulation factor
MQTANGGLSYRRQGAADRRAGLLEIDCPYDSCTDQEKAWLHGWRYQDTLLDNAENEKER